MPAADFFVLPSVDPQHENVLGDDEVLVAVEVPAAPSGRRSTYRKVMDRAAWTHALASVALVLDMDGSVCRSARIVLGGVAPVPWRVPEAEEMLAGRRITVELVERVGEVAVADARPMSKNAYKVGLTRSLVARTLATLSGVA